MRIVSRNSLGVWGGSMVPSMHTPHSLLLITLWLCAAAWRGTVLPRGAGGTWMSMDLPSRLL